MKLKFWSAIAQRVSTCWCLLWCSKKTKQGHRSREHRRERLAYVELGPACGVGRPDYRDQHGGGACTRSGSVVCTHTCKERDFYLSWVRYIAINSIIHSRRVIFALNSSVSARALFVCLVSSISLILFQVWQCCRHLPPPPFFFLVRCWRVALFRGT